LLRKLEKIATVARLPSAITIDAVNADFFKGIYCILDIEGGGSLCHHRVYDRVLIGKSLLSYNLARVHDALGIKGSFDDCHQINRITMFHTQ
jgi:hypothetical protein